MGKYHEMIKDYERQGLLSETALWAMICDTDRLLEEISQNDAQKCWAFLRTTHERFVGKHYNEAFAKARVAAMWNCKDASCSKEEHHAHFTMEQSMDYYRKFKTELPAKVNQYDFYVAINAQALNYGKTFAEWFTDDADKRLVESAVKFWFQDADFAKGKDVKVWEYFED